MARALRGEVGEGSSSEGLRLAVRCREALADRLQPLAAQLVLFQLCARVTRFCSLTQLELIFFFFYLCF